MSGLRETGGLLFLFWGEGSGESGHEAGTRRPPFRVRPPLGRLEVTRGFACTPASKAAPSALASSHGYGLRWGIKGNDFQSLGKSADFPLSRAFARVRKKGNVRCRLLEAARAFALLAALSLHLANDHQMTPPSHGPLIALRAPEALCFGSAVGHRFAGPPT